MLAIARNMVIDFQWLPTERKWTRSGPMWLRSAIINDEWKTDFWVYWKKNAITLKERGYSVAKVDGNWFINQWANTPNAFIKTPKEKAKKHAVIDMKTCLVTEPLKHKKGLKDWQVPIAEKLVASIKKWGAALDGSATGSGKTYVACAVARELGMKIGVICPLSVVTAWKRVITDHFGMKYEFVKNYENIRGGKCEDILLWHHERGKKKYKHWHYQFVCPQDTLLIWDESHRAKGIDTKNSKMLRAAKDQGYKILCASATSAINPMEMRALGFALGLHADKNFWEWIELNGCSRGRWGYSFNNDKHILQKLHKQILIDRGIRITREEIPDFPDCDIDALAYDIGRAGEISLKQIYADMKKELAALSRKSGNNKGDSELVIQLRARQKTELIKIPLIIELIQENIDDGMSVVVFLNFIDSIKAVAEKMHTDCIIWGNNKGTERQDNIDRFQSDKSRIILVSLQAGGTGLSLHDLNGKYPRIAIISPSFSAVDIVQCLGRVHRVGAKTKAIQRIIYAANSVEEEICSAIKQKLNNLDTINDGDCQPSTVAMFKEKKK